MTLTTSSGSLPPRLPLEWSVTSSTTLFPPFASPIAHPPAKGCGTVGLYELRAYSEQSKGSVHSDLAVAKDGEGSDSPALETCTSADIPCLIAYTCITSSGAATRAPCEVPGLVYPSFTPEGVMDPKGKGKQVERATPHLPIPLTASSLASLPLRRIKKIPASPESGATLDFLVTFNHRETLLSLDGSSSTTISDCGSTESTAGDLDLVDPTTRLLEALTPTPEEMFAHKMVEELRPLLRGRPVTRCMLEPNTFDWEIPAKGPLSPLKKDKQQHQQQDGRWWCCRWWREKERTWKTELEEMLPRGYLKQRRTSKPQ